MFYTRYLSKVAPIVLIGDEDGLANLCFDIPDAKHKLEIPDEWKCNEDLFSDVKKQLDEYFAGLRKSFDVKLNPHGTEYQKSVWEQLKNIPYGESTTYKEIAMRIGDANASLAVGNASSKNPIPLIVPCHRVIGSNKKLTGFAFGIELKQKLLNLEKSNI